MTHCLHCEKEKLPSEMALLSDGQTRSNMCNGCWQAYEDQRRLELPAMKRKWSADSIKEVAEGERRAAAKKKKKAEVDHSSEVMEFEGEDEYGLLTLVPEGTA